ncbi:MAG: MOSC domain-containing protein [Actinomycetia bacterium]|nr:MOSC domain-containing protein [Actinomycetes bacterium]
MFSIGPHTFTTTDAERTVSNLDKVWQFYRDGRDASALAPLYPTLTGDLGDDLVRVWEAWTAAGTALRAAGQLPKRAEGTVAGLHRSGGGLPKAAIDRATVEWRGVVGDAQANRANHGRPWQALCIWSAEVIAELHAQGHSVAPGRAGENITLSGLPWEQVRAGVRLQIGGVLCEIGAYALPCFKIKEWFVDGEFETVHHERGPVSRVYATVLQPGEIAVGDIAILEP